MAGNVDRATELIRNLENISDATQVIERLA
jgi:hypothetical protein